MSSAEIEPGSPEHLLAELGKAYPESKNPGLAKVIERYMRDGLRLTPTSTMLSSVKKHYGSGPYVFLKGYLGGGDFPLYQIKRDERGKFIYE